MTQVLPQTNTGARRQQAEAWPKAAEAHGQTRGSARPSSMQSTLGYQLEVGRFAVR